MCYETLCGTLIGCNRGMYVWYGEDGVDEELVEIRRQRGFVFGPMSCSGVKATTLGPMSGPMKVK